jgi:hypothetical protein
MAREWSLGLTHRAARGANVVLGGWLLLSAFLWVHSQPQFNNALIVGCSVAASAALALAAPVLRHVNTVLGGWLLVSAFALPTAHSATVYNSSTVAILVFALSLLREPDHM